MLQAAGLVLGMSGRSSDSCPHRSPSLQQLPGHSLCEVEGTWMNVVALLCALQVVGHISVISLLPTSTCAMGVGMTKEKQAVASGTSHWSTPAAAGILAELIPITISERIDLKTL